MNIYDFEVMQKVQQTNFFNHYFARNPLYIESYITYNTTKVQHIKQAIHKLGPSILRI